MAGMDENPYQSPLTDLSTTKRPSVILWFGGWFFILLGGLLFLPGTLSPLVQWASGSMSFWNAVIGAIILLGLAAASIWIGNRMRLEAKQHS